MTTQISLFLVTAALALPASAQLLELPRESPPARVSQQVGLTEIAVAYNSPGVKGRPVWGALVPYDKTWPISPSQPVTVRFSKDAQVGEHALSAGTYRLSAIPSKDSWTFLFAKLPDIAIDKTAGPISEKVGRAETAELVSARVKVAPKASPHRERLTFLFSDFTDDSVSLDLEWEKLRVSIPIATRTSEQLRLGLNELDTAWRSYANAARFMLETTKDFDAGLRYANQSLALKEDWYTVWIKAALLAAKRDFKGAVAAGQYAYDLGQKQGSAFNLEPDVRKALIDWKKKL
jgi:hypothetical protein